MRGGQVQGVQIVAPHREPPTEIHQHQADEVNREEGVASEGHYGDDKEEQSRASKRERGQSASDQCDANL